MLKIFKQNNIFSAITLLLVTLLVRIYPAFNFYTPTINVNAPVARLVFNFIPQLESYDVISVLTASILIYIQALLINYIGSQHNLLHKNSMLPGLFFILLNSIYKEQLYLSPQIISNTFFIWLIYRICFLYEFHKPLLLVFDCGFLLGLAALFNYDMAIYLPFILLAIVTITSFNLRYFFVAILGMLVPLYFLGVIFYLADNFLVFKTSIVDSLTKTYFNTIGFNYIQNLPWFLIIPILLLSLLRIQANYYKNKVKTRRLQLMLIILMAFSILLLFAENAFFGYAVCYIAIPISYFLGNYFLSDKRMVYRELLIWFIIGLSITGHFIS